MKIIGKTTEGEAIVCVSDDELNRFKEIELGYDDLERASDQWGKTAAAKILDKANVKSYWKLFEMFRSGEFDGSLESISNVAYGKIHIPYIGIGTMLKIQKALEE